MIDADKNGNICGKLNNRMSRSFCKIQVFFDVFLASSCRLHVTSQEETVRNSPAEWFGSLNADNILVFLLN